MATFKLAPNIPVAVELGYIDIVPSEKGGPQVRFKGKIGGEEKVYAYLPGKLPDVLATLGAAGIIAKLSDESIAGLVVTKPIEVKPLKKQFSIVNELIPPAKYGTLKVVGSNGASIPASASIGATGVPTATQKSYTDIYDKATDFIINKIVPKYKTAGYILTGTDVKEMVATVFIPKSKE